MPYAPLAGCSQPGCNKLRIKDKKYCIDHVKQPTTDQQKERIKINNKIYANTTWRRLRKLQLAAFPLCKACLEMIPSRVTAAVEVHHSKEVKEYQEEMFVMENLVSLCSSCHSRITRANQSK